MEVDWSKPIRHVQETVPVEYIGKQTVRAGQPITDGFHHLLLIGQERKASYANDQGQTQVPGKRPYRTVINVKEKPAPKAELSPVQAIADEADRIIEVINAATSEHRDTLEGVEKDVREEILGLKKLVHQWSEAAAKLNTELKGQIESLRQLGRDNQESLLTANMMVLDEIKKLLGGKESPPAKKPEPLPNVSVSQRRITILPKEASPEKVSPFPVDGQRIDYQAMERIECAELKASLGWIMSHPLVSKITVGQYDRRPTNTHMGYVRILGDTPFGMQAKGVDRFRLFELTIFLAQANDRNRKELRDFVDRVNDHIKSVTKVGSK